MKKLITLLFIASVNFSFSQNCIPNISSLEFNGSSTSVSTVSNNALNITDSISIEAWINSDFWGLTQAHNTIVCKHGWSTGESGYVLRAGGSGQLSFTIGADTGGTHLSWREVVSGVSALSLNTWTHVAGTFDGLSLKIYINGILAGTNTLLFPVSIFPSSYNLHIGRLADIAQTETRYWSGMIDEVRIWHRVLSPAEISANMGHHIDSATAVDLVAYWRLNDGTGTNVADMGSGNNHGTVVNGIWSSNVPFSDGPPMPTISSGFPYLYSSSPTNNQWNLNGIPIPNATFLSYVPTQNGSYTVTVTDSNNCSVTSAPFVVTTLSIDNLAPGQLIKVQNFSDGVLRLISSPDILNKAELYMYDLNGRLALSIEKGKLQQEVDIRSLVTGVYMVEVRVEKNSHKTKVVLN